MSTRVSAEQMRELWHHSLGEIDRGTTLGSVTRDDLAALMQGCDDDDWTDGGDPAEHMWQVLAECLNANEPHDLTDSNQSIALQEVAEARRQLHRARDEVGTREADLHDTIRRALATRAPRQTIADEAGVSVPRLYQIRDGRR